MITPDTITVGVVTDETGVAASNNKGFAAFKARIDAQNDAGGVFGRKINLVFEDGQSSATQNLTAVQKIVETSNPFVMVDDSYALSSSYRYLVAQKIPTAKFSVVPLGAFGMFEDPVTFLAPIRPFLDQVKPVARNGRTMFPRHAPSLSRLLFSSGCGPDIFQQP